mmetsp:Transcript_38204/g.91831  ORF Transcript_38204/g.91831 Transcript_38204/m.91831 type:complete len:570 (+) Transcript_38204:66-1775(+)
MLRHSAKNAKRALPMRAEWYHLGDFTMNDADVRSFRETRVRDAKVSNVSAATHAPTAVDWAKWEDQITHKEVVASIKHFHTEQMKLLDAVKAEDHAAAVQTQTNGWELFDDAVTSCAKSVEASEHLVRNGARALFISFHNPPVTQAEQTEWLDTDQYWQAFVEKHHYYHNHLCSVTEDPESKEYDAKIELGMRKGWEKFDGKDIPRFANKLLENRPSYEYYDLYRGPFVEHMIYYLTKAGGDPRFFPEIMPFEWFGEMNKIRMDVSNVLQRKRRAAQEKGDLREAQLDILPADNDHDGATHFAQMIAKHNSLVETCVARLMGNFMFLCEPYTPIQTTSALYRALASDGGAGKFYSLGDDVNALFYKPADSKSPEPVESLNALHDHLALTGKKLPVWYSALYGSFASTLESRKEGLGGAWFAVGDESQADAFLRRLNKFDTARPVYEAYVGELKERLAAKTEVPVDQVVAKVEAIEKLYAAECTEYANILFALNDAISTESKECQERLAKLSAEGEMQGLLDSGSVVVVKDGERLTTADAVAESMREFDATKDGFIDAVMATKTSADGRK